MEGREGGREGDEKRLLGWRELTTPRVKGGYAAEVAGCPQNARTLFNNTQLHNMQQCDMIASRRNHSKV